VELGRFVVLALTGATLDLFFFGEEPLELGIGFLDERGGLFGRLVGRALDLRGFARRTTTTAAGA